MRGIYKNQYKRQDIFSCNHSAHHRFGGNVSTYYILEEKQCFPEGCLNFVWRCRLLNKGHACPKKFSHVGRKCFSCKQFFEEKFCQQPLLKISEAQYNEFLREKEDLDLWIGQHEGRMVEIEAEIAGLKPNLLLVNSRGGGNFRQIGWILVFKEVHINYDLFEDTAFAWISAETQGRWNFSEGVRFEAWARFNFQRGRLVFNHLHRFEISRTSDKAAPDLEKILVATQTATRFPIQPEKCLSCPEGILVENPGGQKDRNGRRRSLVCLRGVINPAECIYHLGPLVESEASAKDSVGPESRKPGAEDIRDNESPQY